MLTSSQKVFDVLEFLCANGPHKALEVSKALSLQKSSVHRFLNSLIEFGYVRKDDQTGLFSVTLKVVQLGAMVSSKIDMVETGRSYMRELVATFDQATVSFATFMDKQVLVLRREYPRNCVTRIDLSQQLPAYCTGLGKALLSTKSEEEIDEYIATVPRTAYTLHTLTDGARLKQDLLAAKEKGYAEDISEISDSLHCVAVPILTPHGGRACPGPSAPHGALFRHPRSTVGKHREASEKGRLGYDLRLFRRARRLTRRLPRAPGKAPFRKRPPRCREASGLRKCLAGGPSGDGCGKVNRPDAPLGGPLRGRHEGRPREGKGEGSHQAAGQGRGCFTGDTP